MHNNYYFLKQLANQLDTKLSGSVVSECFSQAKAELVVRFETHSGSFFLKVSTLPNFSALSFPTNFHRARKNSVDLFPEIAGRKVLHVNSFLNERCIAIYFTDGFTLLLKMHGNRSNVILFDNGENVSLFRSSIQADQTISLDQLDREIDWSFEAFEKQSQNPEQLYFTFGKLVWQYLSTQGIHNLPAKQKWEYLNNFRKQLEEPKFYISKADGSLRLLLFPYGEIIKYHDDPIQAATDFFYSYVQFNAAEQTRSKLISTLNQQLAGAISYIKKNQSRLKELQHENNFKQFGDLIMANLHAINPTMEKVKIQNFYDNNNLIEIKLKPQVTPQKNAENYYRKGKNQQIEINRLHESIQNKEQQIEEIGQKLKVIQDSNDLKLLTTFSQKESNDKKTESVSLPYREFVSHGFRIWVGKNAQANDQLTFKFGYKDDLWLHAKDVAGSHVLIKHQAGRNFPKPVIERAGELAAYHSKRKNDSLCPVSVTYKKFVRKRKGDPAGTVVVEKEEVIMVEPRK